MNYPHCRPWRRSTPACVTAMGAKGYQRRIMAAFSFSSRILSAYILAKQSLSNTQSIVCEAQKHRERGTWRPRSWKKVCPFLQDLPSLCTQYMWDMHIIHTCCMTALGWPFVQFSSFTIGFQPCCTRWCLPLHNPPLVFRFPSAVRSQQEHESRSEGKEVSEVENRSEGKFRPFSGLRRIESGSSVEKHSNDVSAARTALAIDISLNEHDQDIPR